MTIDRVDKANAAFEALLEYAGEIDDIAAGFEATVDNLANMEVDPGREEDRQWAITAIDGAAHIHRDHARTVRELVARGQE